MKKKIVNILIVIAIISPLFRDAVFSADLEIVHDSNIGFDQGNFEDLTTDYTNLLLYGLYRHHGHQHLISFQL